MKKMLFCCAALASLIAVGEAAYSEVDGFYVFDVSGNDAFSGSLSGANGVRKTGTGKLTFTAANSYTGELIVEQGTMAASTPAYFGSMTKITVKPSATLDISPASGSDTSVGTLKSASLFIEGAGVGGEGAVKRTSGGLINGVFKAVTLTGDATINISQRWGIGGTLTLNGHKMTRIGSAHGILPGTTVVPDFDESKGSIESTTGDFNLQAAVNLNGSADNVLKVTGGRLMLYQATGTRPWTCEIGGNVNFDGDGAGTGIGKSTYNIWQGPVMIDAGFKCTFRALSVDKGLRLAGPVVVNGQMGFDGPGFFGFSGALTNDNSGLVIPSCDVEFSGGSHRISGDSMVQGRLSYCNGAAMEMGRNCHHYIGSADVETPASLTVSNAVLSGFPNGSCKLRPGQLNGSRKTGFGYVRIGKGAQVSDYTVEVGYATNGVSGFYMNGGVVNRQDTQVIANVGYGYMGMCGGEHVAVGTTSDKKATYVGMANFGALHQSGGIYSGDYVIIATGSGSGEVFMSGGTNNTYAIVLQSGSTASDVTAGTALLAITGSNTVMDAGHSVTKVERRKSSTSVLSVSDGGTLKTGRLFLETEARTAGAEFHVGFDGGVICPTLISDFFDTGTYAKLPTSLVLYDGGVTIDTSYTGDYDGTLGTSSFFCEFKSPTGKSVKSVSLPTDSEFVAQAGKYLGSPRVVISGKGKAAAAVAVFDDVNRTLTGIKVVSPGFGYDDDTTAKIRSWDGRSEYECAVTVEAQRGVGGIRKRGKQDLMLCCDAAHTNTFGGAVEAIEGSVLFSASDSVFPEGIGLVVHPGAKIGLGMDRTVKYVNGAGQITGAGITVTESMCLSTNGLQVTDGVTTLVDGLQLSIDPDTPIKKDSQPVTLLTAHELRCDHTRINVAGLPENWGLGRKGNSLIAKQIRCLCMIIR